MAEYLDKDDVLEVANYIRTKYISVYNRKDKCSQFWADTIRYFEKKINSLASCDIDNINHGVWYLNNRVESENYGRHYCSCCGQYAKEFGYQGEFLTEYCYYCGARMDTE